MNTVTTASWLAKNMGLLMFVEGLFMLTARRAIVLAPLHKCMQIHQDALVIQLY